MAITSRLIAKFNTYYADKPDTVAQSLTAIRSKSKRSYAGLGKDISDGIEMPDYDEKHPYSTIDFIGARKNLPPAFDFERLTRFMSYPFLVSPIQYQWFKFLAKSFPITKQSATIPTLQRMCFDQLIFAPMGEDLPPSTKTKIYAVESLANNASIGLAAFFTFMTVTEGGGRRAVARKFQDVYLPALKANFMLWPAVQFLNFRVVPIPFQIVSPFF
ncbi:MAG: hypothetical protein Q9191_007144 [Dirinaria sp. TL-2023a]